MITHNTTLRTIFDGWETNQKNLIRALTPLSSAQLTLCAAPELRTIGGIAQHIIGARARWFHDALREGSDEVATLRGWDRRGAPARTAEELVHGLETSWEELKRALERWTPEDFAGTITDEYQGKTYTLSREWIIWHLIEHDVHHGGEISLTLGMHGLKAPDL